MPGEALGDHNILFATDFPHTTSLTPPEMDWAIEVGLGDLAEDVKERVLWRNAAELYHVDVPHEA